VVPDEAPVVKDILNWMVSMFSITFHSFDRNRAVSGIIKSAMGCPGSTFVSAVFNLNALPCRQRLRQPYFPAGYFRLIVFRS